MKKKTMPRAFALLLAVALVCSSIIAVPSTDAQAAAQIKLSPKKQTLYVGGKKGSFTLKATGKAAKKVTYKSNKPGVASVNGKGKVTAKSAGTATITVTSKSNKKAKATCKVTVKEGIKSIQTASKLVMQKGKSVKLNLGFTPSNAANAKAKEMAFATSKKSVATVDKNGKIKAKKAGSAKITVEPKDKSAKKVTIKVTVKNKITPVKKITLNKTEMALNVGAIEKLTTTLTPKKPTSKNLYWVSDNTNVATVKNGTVTAVSNGTAKITAYATDNSGKKATCTVTVTTAATSITLDQAAMTFTVGEAAKVLTATLAPETVSDPTVTWTVDNPAVATVTSPGLQTTVTPVAAGTATVTATTSNGLTATCVVTVNPAAPVTPDGKVFTLPKNAKAYKIKLSDEKEKTVSAENVNADYNEFVSKALNATYTETFLADNWAKIAAKLNDCRTAKELYSNFAADLLDDNSIKITAGSREFTVTPQENKIVITNGKRTVEFSELSFGASEDKTRVTFSAKAKVVGSQVERTMKVEIANTGITVTRMTDGVEKTYMTIANGTDAYTITVYPDSRDDLGLANIDYDKITVEPVMN